MNFNYLLLSSEDALPITKYFSLRSTSPFINAALLWDNFFVLRRGKTSTISRAIRRPFFTRHCIMVYAQKGTVSRLTVEQG